MIKRTVEISREAMHLSVRDEQLLLLRKEEEEQAPRRHPARPANLAASIPCEDLGVLVVDSRETTYSHHALTKLAEHGAALVVCGRDHHPVGMYLPISVNTQLLARLDAQLSASRPTLKRLWAMIVSAKIRAQAVALPPFEGAAPIRTRLLHMARRVRSGDPENVEAQAAGVYWPELFRACPAVRQPFRRRPGDPTAEPPNNLLDYGYAAVRAAVARALVSAGLLPALGIRHRGRSNPFCLADDLMEPLRPLVDRRVRHLAERGEVGLDRTTKTELLSVLTEEIVVGPFRGPLLVSTTRYVSSLVESLDMADPGRLMTPCPLGGTPERRGTHTGDPRAEAGDEGHV
jgi:CRISPR-associated protein Cas1